MIYDQAGTTSALRTDHLKAVCLISAFQLVFSWLASWLAGCDHSLCRLCVVLISLSPQTPLSFFMRPQRRRAPVSPDVTQHTASSSALKSRPLVPFPSRRRNACQDDPSSWATDTPSVVPRRRTGGVPPGSDNGERKRETKKTEKDLSLMMCDYVTGVKSLTNKTTLNQTVLN